MKAKWEGRRLYALSIGLMGLTVALCCAWSVWGKPASETVSAKVEPTAAATAEKKADLVSTVVYYQDNFGYLVPVMKTMENQTGVAKATLQMMVSSPENDMAAARLGLRTVIPENTQVDLDIADGTARIDLSREADTFTDAAAERNMVDAIVQTLTEFPTVKTVSFLIGGQRKDALSCGTDLSGPFERSCVNLESRDDGLLPDEASAVTLYFAGDSESVIVPVSRMVYGEGDLPTAVLELVKGPDDNSPLVNTLPNDCGLVSVKQENGKVTVNFTKEFMALFENRDGGRQALRALALTCAQFSDVVSVEVQVEGVPYDVGSSALAIPGFVNVESALLDTALQTQAEALMDIE